MLRLGIDYGGKFTGLAVVDTRTNNVLYAKTVRMRSDIPDKMLQRRALRSMRRCRKSRKRRLRDLRNYLDSTSLSQTAKDEIYRLAHKRGYDYREYDPESEELLEQEETPKARHREEVLQDIENVMVREGSTEEQINRVKAIINKQYRPTRYKNRILTKCKICGKNTPLKKNVRHLLLENIVVDLPIQKEQKQTIRELAFQSEPKKKLIKFFRKVHINEFSKKLIYDIVEGKLTGRTVFCKYHILEHLKYSKVPKATVQVLPSTKVKIENVIKVIEEEILPKYEFQEVVMEANKFDVAARTRGKARLPKRERQKGHVKKEKGLVQTLYEEFKGYCVYCGNNFDISRMTQDHIFPKKKGGLNIFANLALACRDCNGKKGGRTPIEWGTLPKPHVIDLLKNDLKKKILLDATVHSSLDFNKYMGQASIGWRYLSQRLQELSQNGLGIQRESGLVTAHYRKWWGFFKEAGNPVHHALDAVILASRRETNDEGMVDMTLKPNIEPEKLEPKDYLIEYRAKQDRKSSQLHEQNPVSCKNGKITQRKMVTDIKRGKEDRIVSDQYRAEVISLFEKYNIPKGKSLSDEQVAELECRRLKCEVKGTGLSQMAKLKNNYYKIETPNDSVVVGKDKSGKVYVVLMKNRYLRDHMAQEPLPKGFITEKVFKRGDLVVDQKGEVFTVTKLSKKLVLKNREGVRKDRSPKTMRKIG